MSSLVSHVQNKLGDCKSCGCVIVACRGNFHRLKWQCFILAYGGQHTAFPFALGSDHRDTPRAKFHFQRSAMEQTGPRPVNVTHTHTHQKKKPRQTRLPKPLACIVVFESPYGEKSIIAICVFYQCKKFCMVIVRG